MKDWSTLERDLAEFHIILSDLQKDQLEKYYDILVEWNSFMNLTAITQFEEVCKKHFLDSISLIHAVPDLSEKDYSLIDVGTGAGFPGIPLKIFFPNLKVTLLDSLGKRVKFLNEGISLNGLTDMSAFHLRAEDAGSSAQFREKYDLCVSRAVANLSTLSEYGLPFVKKNGFFIPYKAELTQEEIDKAQKAIHMLGGKEMEIMRFILPGTDYERSFYKVLKISSTPKLYPRKAGIPSKTPI